MPILTPEEKLRMMKANNPTTNGFMVGEFEIRFQRTNDILEKAMEVFPEDS